MSEPPINWPRTLRQVLFWCFIWLMLPIIGGISMGWEIVLDRSLLIAITASCLVFLNVAYLVPRLLIRKKYLLYILLGLSLVISLSILSQAISQYIFSFPDIFPEPPERFFEGRRRRNLPSFTLIRYFSRSFPLMTTFIGSALFELTVFANQQRQEAVKLRNENLETEMKFLKSQINPHFLFNALNNIYSLSILTPQASSENLLKLSDMLRYMLYECNTDFVSLQRELEYIQNLIGLNMLKDSRGLNVRVEIPEIPKHVLIRPLLFIPFIENAFKHSNIEQLDTGWIRLEMKVEHELVKFDLENSCSKYPETRDKQGGIGLANVKRRLELYYAGKHELEIEQESDRFAVHLTIDLS